MSVLALLTCCDSTLTNTVRAILAPIDGLTLEVADHLLDSVEILSGGDGAIWLVLADPEAIGETADVIRQLVMQIKTPVIVLGEDNPQSAFTFMQSGAKDYLPQPINGKHLRFLVDDSDGGGRAKARRPRCGGERPQRRRRPRSFPVCRWPRDGPVDGTGPTRRSPTDDRPPRR